MTYLPRAKVNDLIVQDLATETLIYNSKNHRVFCLNDTLKIVYLACDGKTSFDEVKARHGLTDDLINLALDELQREDLLEDSQAYQSPLAGLSRREAIARVGLASAFALPTILSTVVGTPAQAASLLPLLANCSSNSQCASNFCTNGPPRCCVPGTQGIRGVSLVCCTQGVDCDTACCVGTVPVFTSSICNSIGRNGAVSCP